MRQESGILRIWLHFQATNELLQNHNAQKQSWFEPDIHAKDLLAAKSPKLNFEFV